MHDDIILNDYDMTNLVDTANKNVCPDLSCPDDSHSDTDHENDVCDVFDYYYVLHLSDDDEDNIEHEDSISIDGPLWDNQGITASMVKWYSKEGGLSWFGMRILKIWSV